MIGSASGFEGEPLGGPLDVGLDGVDGTVPSADGVVVVVNDEMIDELMIFFVNPEVFYTIIENVLANQNVLLKWVGYLIVQFTMQFTML